MSADEMLDFIERNEAWLTFAGELQGTKQAWRCAVGDRQFPSPDIRERAGAYGYGLTAREAIAACAALNK